MSSSHYFNCLERRDFSSSRLRLWKATASASEFKATCLGEIEQSGESIIITRRGRPVAVLGPATHRVQQSPRNSWARKAHIDGDIVNASISWEVAGSE